MGETLDLSGIYKSDREILRGMATRMRKLHEIGLPPVLSAPTKRAKTRKDRLHLLAELERLDTISKSRELTGVESHRLEYLVMKTMREESGRG